MEINIITLGRTIAKAVKLVNSFLPEVDEELKTIEQEIEEIRLRTLLKGKYDDLNAIGRIHC